MKVKTFTPKPGGFTDREIGFADPLFGERRDGLQCQGCGETNGKRNKWNMLQSGVRRRFVKNPADECIGEATLCEVCTGARETHLGPNGKWGTAYNFCSWPAFPEGYAKHSRWLASRAAAGLQCRWPDVKQA